MGAERIAVVGAGLMGHGIAQVLACAGHAVVVHDPAPDALASVRSRVADNLTRCGGDPAVAETIELAAELDGAVAGAAWVFEAAPEQLALKQELFARLDAVAPPGAVLCSNSSVMRVGDVGAQARRRERIVGTHWWNPAHLVPLVEVVQGDETDPAVVQRAIALLAAAGKLPVHVRRDVAGFVGNRLQHALWREAFDLIDEGVCDAETVDTVVKQGFGRRLAALGPVENADLVGLELTLAIHAYLLPRLHPPSEPSPGLRARVGRGQLGMASGEGWRRWTVDEAAVVRQRIRDALAAKAAAA